MQQGKAYAAIQEQSYFYVNEPEVIKQKIKSGIKMFHKLSTPDASWFNFD